MANLKAFIDSPLFYDDTELSASLMNVLRNNAVILETAAFIPQPIHDIHRALNVQNNLDVWKGGFQYRVGLTTATFIIYTRQVSGQGEHEIVVTFDDVEVARYDARIGGTNVGGFHGLDLAINTRGYADFQIITVKVIIAPVAGGGPDDATKGIQYVFDAYVHPLSNVATGSTWPGTPSFGTVDGTKLNQLANAEDYLGNRLSTIPMPLSMGYIQWMGTNNPRYPNFRYFTARATNGNNRLRTNVWFRPQNVSSSITLNINGILFSQGPFTAGQQILIKFDIDMIAAGLSWNVDYFAFLQETVHTRGAPDDGFGGYKFSKVDNGPIWTASNDYTPNTGIAESFIRESVTYTTLQARLNSISNSVAGTYSRMNANPRAFDRATMFRGRYGINQGQNEYWATTFVPSTYRQGDILWVKGQGLKIAYGPTTQKPKTDTKPNDVQEYSFANEKELLDGDKMSQQFFYLDQFEGLYPGMRYHIIGKDVIYASEHLR